MQSVRKEIRQQIHAYFKKAGVKHIAKVFAYQKYQMVDIEYEDYHSETRVMDDLRKFIPEEFLINVKRECSDEMLMEIHLYNMTMGDKSQVPKTIYAAKAAVLNLIPTYEHSWMTAR